ncbi:hypothetical protein BJ546DRAFT_1067429 [Cryomyces antarcticus]|uniref:Uncharacterized protein n=1 Tax=Cryomyces antarcticus TaxID=329879 RepID=A0ABR0KUV7_9PEZI|nr:hypothetical protein LTR39_000121 [Cryomyces antarcticus]KAK5020068.1 hypothetical protein LTR60_000868 [Cryomyces antarcticus]KAK5131965.1 hypothetical protein LTR16_000241 [Cryomyces antarcticus]
MSASSNMSFFQRSFVSWLLCYLTMWPSVYALVPAPRISARSRVPGASQDISHVDARTAAGVEITLPILKRDEPDEIDVDSLIPVPGAGYTQKDPFFDLTAPNWYASDVMDFYTNWSISAYERKAEKTESEFLAYDLVDGHRGMDCGAGPSQCGCKNMPSLHDIVEAYPDDAFRARQVYFAILQLDLVNSLACVYENGLDVAQLNSYSLVPDMTSVFFAQPDPHADSVCSTIKTITMAIATTAVIVVAALAPEALGVLEAAFASAAGASAAAVVEGVETSVAEGAARVAAGASEAAARAGTGTSRAGSEVAQVDGTASGSGRGVGSAEAASKGKTGLREVATKAKTMVKNLPNKAKTVFSPENLKKATSQSIYRKGKWYNRIKDNVTKEVKDGKGNELSPEKKHVLEAMFADQLNLIVLQMMGGSMGTTMMRNSACGVSNPENEQFKHMSAADLLLMGAIEPIRHDLYDTYEVLNNGSNDGNGTEPSIMATQINNMISGFPFRQEARSMLRNPGKVSDIFSNRLKSELIQRAWHDRPCYMHCGPRAKSSTCVHSHALLSQIEFCPTDSIICQAACWKDGTDMANEPLYGYDKGIDQAPWNIDLTSVVKTSWAQYEQDPVRSLTHAAEGTAWNPSIQLDGNSVPTLAVCRSNATSIVDYTKGRSGHHDKFGRFFPCTCGDEWGSESEAFWAGANWASIQDKGAISRTCRKQLSEHFFVGDPGPFYVNMCKLNAKLVFADVAGTGDQHAADKLACGENEARVAEMLHTGKSKADVTRWLCGEAGVRSAKVTGHPHHEDFDFMLYDFHRMCHEYKK